jgi:hypothetical protein
MTYLSNVANERPMLRISATIILAFTCAAPFVLLFSGVVGYGLRSLIHWKSERWTAKFSTLMPLKLPTPLIETVAWESVTTIVTVSIAATAPSKATGLSTLRVMSLSPEFGSIYTIYQNHLSAFCAGRDHD